METIENKLETAALAVVRLGSALDLVLNAGANLPGSAGAGTDRDAKARRAFAYALTAGRAAFERARIDCAGILVDDADETPRTAADCTPAARAALASYESAGRWAHLGEHVGASDVCMDCSNALADFRDGWQLCAPCHDKRDARARNGGFVDEPAEPAPAPAAPRLLGQCETTDPDGDGGARFFIYEHTMEPDALKAWAAARYPGEHCRHAYDCCGRTYNRTGTVAAESDGVALIRQRWIRNI